MALSRRRVAYASIVAHCVAFVTLLRYAGLVSRPTALLWSAALVLQFTWSATVGLMYAGRRSRRWALWWTPLPVLVSLYCWPGVSDAAASSICVLAAALAAIGAGGVLAGCRLSSAIKGWRATRLRSREAALPDQAVVEMARTPSRLGQ